MISGKDGITLPLFLLHLPTNEASNRIFKLLALFHIRVEIEKYRPHKKATQCFNGQGFFHHARHCFLKPKCVGWAKNTCQELAQIIWIIICHSNDPKPEPLCCNCNGQHPASYKRCKNFPLRHKFKESFANIVQNSDPSSSDKQTATKIILLL